MKKTFLTVLAFSLAGSIANAQFWGFQPQPQDPSDPYTITAGETSMTIDAGRGAKIMSYKYGETEILSQRTFPNQFGSTFWTSPQVEWNWPPVQEYDSRKYTVEKNGDKLVMTSQLSEKLPFRIIKEFVPDSKEGIITINYTIKNEGEAAREVAPWEVTRVLNGGLIFFDAPVESISPAGLMPFTSEDGVCWLVPDENRENRKINADGKGWLAYADNGLLLVKKFTDLKGDLKPAPGESEIQVYINSGKTYIEIENQGAYTMLQPGETLTWTVVWKLMPLKTEAVPSRELAKQARPARKVSILGDSYSTFKGVNPDGYAPFYPDAHNDVKEESQTWWSLYNEAMGYTLEVNDSWGGTTICNTGYFHRNVAGSSFNSRLWKLGNPDIIFVFGGTNDAWANAPLGEYKYSDISKEDCNTLRPAIAYMLDALARIYPEATVYAILNSELKEEVNESFREICSHCGVQLIELHDIEKQNGHPSINGMKAICDQLLEAIK